MRYILKNCPGSQKFRQPQPDAIKCPSCAEEVEIWSDEIKVKCPRCKTTLSREAEMTCLDWCHYAKECAGEEIYNRYTRNRTVTLREKLIKELEEYFGPDKKRINHAQEVMTFAEELLKKEKGDFHIVIPASLLHDVGIKVAEEKYGSSAGAYQEKEGVPVARKILLKMGLKREDIEEIGGIIAHHHSPGKINTQNFKILYDADGLVNLKEEADLKNKTKLKAIIERRFLTPTGKELAEKIYL